MHEFWYDYVKPKYGENAKHMDTDSFIAQVKAEDIYKDIAKDVEKIFWHLKFWIRQAIA